MKVLTLTGAAALYVVEKREYYLTEIKQQWKGEPSGSHGDKNENGRLPGFCAV